LGGAATTFATGVVADFLEGSSSSDELSSELLSALLLGAVLTMGFEATVFFSSSEELSSELLSGAAGLGGAATTFATGVVADFLEGSSSSDELSSELLSALC